MRREERLAELPMQTATMPRPRYFQICVLGERLSTHDLPSKGTLTIGCSDEADIQVEDASMSPLHAALHIDQSVKLENLGGSSGVRVEGRALPIGEQVRLWPGQPFFVGAVTVAILPCARPTARARAARCGKVPIAYFKIRLPQECATADPERILAGSLKDRGEWRCERDGLYEVVLFDINRGDAEARFESVVKALSAVSKQVEAAFASLPEDAATLEELIVRVSRQLRRERAKRPETDVVVLDPSMQRIHRLAERVAEGDVSALLLGETGVGKEVVAELIHKHSRREPHPFLRLNCAALSESLLESELFGHERGAFSGAVQTKPGLLETADRGSIFLDEIGEMPISIQAKLLRVLDERRITRVGGLKSRPIDVRLIAATNRDLLREVSGGRFRQDLYYRLNGISIVIPPLRQRGAEIVALAEAFIRRSARQLGREGVPALDEAAVQLLLSHSWPGNVRELRNTIESAILLCSGDSITPDQLQIAGRGALDFSAASHGAEDQAVAGTAVDIEAAERHRIVEALTRCAGNQTRAAEYLGIARSTLVARLVAYELPRPRKRFSATK